MADTATEIDLDSVIDRLLEGEFGLPILLGLLRAGQTGGKGLDVRRERELSSLDFVFW